MNSLPAALLRLGLTLALTAATAGAHADLLSDHAQVHVQAFGLDNLTPLYQFSETAASDLDSTVLVGGDGFGYSGAGRAAVSLRDSALLEVEAASSSPLPHGTSTAFATAWSRAAFRDAVGFDDLAVDTLRFRFELAGTLAVSDVTGGGFTPRVSRAYLVAFGNGESFEVPAGPPVMPVPGDGWSVLVEDRSSLSAAANGHRTLITSDWIAPEFARVGEAALAYAFEGSFEVVSHRLTGASLTAAGSFPLVVGLDVVASNRGGASAAGFTGSLRLAAVTDGAGNPLPLSGLQFQSGLQPIPEPDTWALLSLGLALLAWAGRRRR